MLNVGFNSESHKTLIALYKIKSSLTTQVNSTFFWPRVPVFAVIKYVCMYVFEYDSRLMLNVD